MKQMFGTEVRLLGRQQNRYTEKKLGY